MGVCQQGARCPQSEKSRFVSADCPLASLFFLFARPSQKTRMTVKTSTKKKPAASKPSKKTAGQLVVVNDGKNIVKFAPERHRLQVAGLDYTIEEAKRVREWPVLERAVDDKIEEQKQFAGWWKATVGPAGRRKNNPGRNYLSVAEAERLTGMKQPRVSKLGKLLETPDKYRKRLLGVAYRAAMLTAEGNQRTKALAKIIGTLRRKISSVPARFSAPSIVILHPTMRRKRSSRLRRTILRKPMALTRTGTAMCGSTPHFPATRSRRQLLKIGWTSSWLKSNLATLRRQLC